MPTMFSTQTYHTRRALLKKRLSKGIILLMGNSEAPVNFSDNTDKGFGGIRVEDDIVITHTGYRILGKPLSKTLAALEQLRAEAC